MDDLISRQAVMDATKAVMKDTLDSLPTRLEDGEEVYDVRTSELDFILGINKALQNAIKALPSETHDLRTETHGVCLDELISRQKALDACAVSYYASSAYTRIEALPSKSKSGKWIHKTGVYGVVYCSECDYELHSNNTNFCPHCGSYNGGEER